MSRRVESPEDKDSLGDHEDASKHGRSIEDIDKDADVSLVDDTQGRSDDADMFDIDNLHGDEVNVDMPVGDNQEQSARKNKKGTEESSKGIEDELESDKSKKAESSEEKTKGNRKKMLSRKRAGKEQQQESSKRQRIEDDK
ncbi:hypothetical protein Tco_0680413 [Tanacetum coccineum]|uniref:Uncharacterized protein n=1 Tax=Tanacetum coccineum TaxID=301880 RepID=A0ABQ4XKS3_9ASTR